VATTIDFYKKVLEHPVFQSGRYYVGWLEKIQSEKKNQELVIQHQAEKR
jgi:biotin carboxylase